MITALRIAGLLQVVLALAHIPIARHLRWREELANNSLLTRQVFWSHTWFLCLTLAMFGVLPPRYLVDPSPLAFYVASAIAVFWANRLAFQWLHFDASHWRGKGFETTIHVLFTLTWAGLTGVYGTAAYLQWVARAS